MTRQRMCQILLNEGYIERVRVNRYRITESGVAHIRVDQRRPSFFLEWTRDQIVRYFGVGQEDSWEFHPNYFRRSTTPATDAGYVTVDPCASRERGTVVNGPARRTVERPVLRTISRQSYHWSGSGTGRSGVGAALANISTDTDGVKRSFGLEWEIYSLTAEQEDKLARLLDTMPTHFTERDGSLSDRGVEIIFLPLGEEKIKEVWNKLQSFCRENNVAMNNTGAHLTYGVNNSQIDDTTDLTIRLNRIALAVKAAASQREIKAVFGRDFTNYAHLPNTTSSNPLLQTEHSMAWSASRGCSAYELRLCHWLGNIDRIVEFMKVTEFVFTRPFTANDFMNIFRVMGANCSEA